MAKMTQKEKDTRKRKRERLATKKRKDHREYVQEWRAGLAKKPAVRKPKVAKLRVKKLTAAQARKVHREYVTAWKRGKRPVRFYAPF